MPRYIDLTLTLRHGMRGVEFEPKFTVDRHGWNARTLHLYSHAGTHMDAQTHFNAGPETIDQIPLTRCMGNAWVARIADIRPAQSIGLSRIESVAGRVRPGDSLLLYTGWSRYIDNPSLYRDQLPPLDEFLAQWCVERRIKILGVEPPSVATVSHLESLTRIHKTLLEGGVTIVEGLAHLDQLSADQVFFAALPLKVDSGDGCPCRAFAIEDDTRAADSLHSCFPNSNR